MLEDWRVNTGNQLLPVGSGDPLAHIANRYRQLSDSCCSVFSARSCFGLMSAYTAGSLSPCCCWDVAGFSFTNVCVSCHCRRTTPEKFYIEPCDDGSEDVLAIDRVSTEMTLTGKHRSGDWSLAHTVYGWVRTQWLGIKGHWQGHSWYELKTLLLSLYFMHVDTKCDLFSVWVI